MKFLPIKFETFGPILPGVKIIEIWANYDGPLFGVCEIENIHFFFMDCIYDMWRHYAEYDLNRLWRIYAVYDIDIDKAREIVKEKGRRRSDWEGELKDISEVIGIFWEY